MIVKAVPFCRKGILYCRKANLECNWLQAVGVIRSTYTQVAGSREVVPYGLAPLKLTVCKEY